MLEMVLFALKILGLLRRLVDHFKVFCAERGWKISFSLCFFPPLCDNAGRC